FECERHRALDRTPRTPPRIGGRARLRVPLTRLLVDIDRCSRRPDEHEIGGVDHSLRRCGFGDDLGADPAHVTQRDREPRTTYEIGAHGPQGAALPEPMLVSLSIHATYVCLRRPST